LKTSQIFIVLISGRLRGGGFKNGSEGIPVGAKMASALRQDEESKNEHQESQNEPFWE
jgi:hypothetical protein